MQYQVYRKDTNEVVAWINTNNDEHIVHKDYDIKAGENLTAVETEEAPMKTVAKFEKVSLEQYCRDHMGYEYDEDCTDTKEEYDNIQLPLRKTKGSAGYDFIAPFDIVIPPHSTLKFVTGVKCQIEEGYVLELYPRSSLGFKHRLSLNNTVGIIDSDYYNNENNEGHIQCKFYNPNDYEVVVERGEAYMQGIFKEFFLAEEDEVTAERKGGIGSTNL